MGELNGLRGEGFCLLQGWRGAESFLFMACPASDLWPLRELGFLSFGLLGMPGLLEGSEWSGEPFS